MTELRNNQQGASKRTLAYRADIDGLRAIAVLLVLAFHFGIPPITGGFIGVDVFFVISGFLISSLLSNESSLSGALPNFYARRAKRLMPAFLLVLVVTTVAAVIFLLPQDFTNYLKSAHATLTFRSNSFFQEEISNYFSANAHELPLLHTWSLSIEWQFYLIFPAAYLLAKKWLQPRVFTVFLVAVTAALTYLSTSLTIGQEAYFSTAARFFELMLGVLAGRFEPKLTATQRKFLVGAALLGILALSVLFSPATPFPGLNALAACLLTALLILCGKGVPLLSSRWLVHIGKISYSAYLWHWPLIALLNYLQIETAIPFRLLLIALVLVVADQTYRHVEQPGKKLKFRFLASAIVLCLLPMLLARGAYLLAWKNDGFPQRLGTEARKIHETLSEYADIGSHACSKDKAKWLLASCDFGGKGSKDILYVIGDSHAKNHRWLADVLAQDTGMRTIVRSHGGCLMLPGIAHNYGKPGDATRCANAVEEEYARIAALRPKYVMLIQRWNVLYPKDEIALLSQAIDRIVASGAIPVIVGQSAESGVDMNRCVFQHIKLRRAKEGTCVISQADQAAKTNIDFVDKTFAELRVRYPTLTYIDLQATQCSAGKCVGEIDGMPIYDDDNHLNGFGSARLAEAYRKRFATPVLP